MNNKHTCEKCNSPMEKTQITKAEIAQKIQLLIEQEQTFGGLAPHNMPLKNFALLSFLLTNCYVYFECKKCGWWKFKKC